MFSNVLFASVVFLTNGLHVHAFLPTSSTWSHCSWPTTSVSCLRAQQSDDHAVATQNKALVRSTWAMADEALGVQATQLFYQRLFEQYPSVQPLFANTNMDTQALHLHQTIQLAVETLDDLDTLVPILQKLGARHATKYQAELPHYSAVGETLLWTLEQGLGPDNWTPQVAEAWAWVYGVIADTMAQGAQEAKNTTAEA